jgi:hypothetical protein
LRGELVAGVDESDEWLTSYVIDQLYLQMCEGPQVSDPHDEGCKYSDQQINYHYLEAVNFARRISCGNFQGRNTKYKPVFTINATGFTPKLKDELKIANDAKSLHRIVTEAVFRIFKARYKLIFYEHIEPHKLSWNIINL